MKPVKISSNFRILIPREVRESMNLQPGESMYVFETDGRIEMVRARSIGDFRGRFGGIDTSIDRDIDRV